MNHRQIVWIASYPKSGNTWARCFLDAYFLNDVDINEIVTSVSDDVAGVYQVGDGSDITKLPIDIQNLARPMAMLRLARMHNSTRGDSFPLFVKTHQPHLVANGIEIIPECLTKAVIFIVRDPRDVLPSFARHMGKDMDMAVEWMTDKYRTLSSNDNRVGELISSWDKHAISYLNADTHNVLIVRYEDMIANPVTEFARMLEHAGVTPDMEKVKRAVEVVNIDKLKSQEEQAGFKESSPYAKNQFFKAQKETPAPKHIHRIEREFGRVMKRLGYINKIKVA